MNWNISVDPACPPNTIILTTPNGVADAIGFQVVEESQRVLIFSPTEQSAQERYNSMRSAIQSYQRAFAEAMDKAPLFSEVQKTGVEVMLEQEAELEMERARQRRMVNAERVLRHRWYPGNVVVFDGADDPSWYCGKLALDEVEEPHDFDCPGCGDVVRESEITVLFPALPQGYLVSPYCDLVVAKRLKDAVLSKGVSHRSSEGRAASA